MLQPKGIH